MNREHLFPKWLILRTRTHQTSIRWGKSKIPALSATLPLCIDCNTEFGDKLEKATSKIFLDLESNKGISDNEAEMLIRWLWKIEGLNWIAVNPDGDYTRAYTLKERVLRPITNIRDRIVLAISLFPETEEDQDDLPMGIDSHTEHNAIFVSGVFSRIAIMAVLDIFHDYIPSNFSTYTLKKKPDDLSDAKLFYPTEGFMNSTDAVGITVHSSIELTRLHDEYSLQKLYKYKDIFD